MSLVQMSLSGGVIILAVTAIRALGKNWLPKSAFTALWTLAVLRLVLPFSIPSPWSAYSLFRRSVTVAPAIQTAAAPAAMTAAPMPQASELVGITNNMTQPPAGTTVSPWAVVWAVGAVICAGVFAASYVRCRRMFAASLPVESAFIKQWLDAHKLRRAVTIRQSDRITAPLTYGVLRPVILFPRAMDWGDEQTLGFVLAHESTHIRRFDAVRKPVLAGVLCLHWFNPTVWVMYVLASRDMELACDEAVIRRCGLGQRGAYAHALLTMEQARGSFASLASSFSKSAVEERIVSIMKIKPTSILSILLAAVLVLGTATVFATSADAAVSEAEAVATVFQDITITEDNYEAPFPVPVVEWWTYEEYAQWLEQEKLALQDCLGAKAWTSGDGWFTWTQEKIDETVALYEQILEQIQNGALISKTVDGSSDVVLGSSIPLEDAVYTAEDEFITATYLADRAELWETTLAPYAPFGVAYTYDPATDDFKLYWNNKEVRGITDEEAQLWISEHAGISSYGEDAVELYAVYEDGKLAGLREATAAEQAAWTQIRREATDALVRAGA